MTKVYILFILIGDGMTEDVAGVFTTMEACETERNIYQPGKYWSSQGQILGAFCEEWELKTKASDRDD